MSKTLNQIIRLASPNTPLQPTPNILGTRWTGQVRLPLAENDKLRDLTERWECSPAQAIERILAAYHNKWSN